MGNPSQTETGSGSGRNQQQKAPPEGVPPAARPVEPETRERTKGGAQPGAVKNR